MFGYVITSPALSDGERARYKSFYCGLCAALKERYGNVGRITLSYDMTFLSLVLTALYELDEKRFEQKCPTHPGKPQQFLQSEATWYCADMNIVLAYYKASDDWLDDKNLRAKLLLNRLEKPMEAVRKRYPDKCAAIESCLHEMHAIESSGQNVLDQMCNLTGQMLGEIYAWRNDLWSSTLYRMGEGIGRFIYLMDAYDDLKRDEEKNRYNPLRELHSQPQFDDYVEAGLTMMIAEGTEAFEELPILQDASVIRNVLYSGVWSRYAYLRKKVTKEQHHGR